MVPFSLSAGSCIQHNVVLYTHIHSHVHIYACERESEFLNNSISRTKKMFLGETQCSNINRGLRFPMLIIKEHNSIYIHSQLQSICCNATRTNRKRTIAWTWRFSALLKLNRNVENVKPWDLYSLIISMARWILPCLLSLACTTLYWKDRRK